MIEIGNNLSVTIATFVIVIGLCICSFFKWKYGGGKDPDDKE